MSGFALSESPVFRPADLVGARAFGPYQTSVSQSIVCTTLGVITIIQKFVVYLLLRNKCSGFWPFPDETFIICCFHVYWFIPIIKIFVELMVLVKRCSSLRSSLGLGALARALETPFASCTLEDVGQCSWWRHAHPFSSFWSLGSDPRMGVSLQFLSIANVKICSWLALKNACSGLQLSVGPGSWHSHGTVIWAPEHFRVFRSEFNERMLRNFFAAPAQVLARPGTSFLLPGIVGYVRYHLSFINAV